MNKESITYDLINGRPNLAKKSLENMLHSLPIILKSINDFWPKTKGIKGRLGHDDDNNDYGFVFVILIKLLLISQPGDLYVHASFT